MATAGEEDKGDCGVATKGKDGGEPGVPIPNNTTKTGRNL
jgi:hypothetical protein